MNFTTDCQFLENELLDVVRLFKRRPEALTHSFRFEEGVFFNAFTVDGTEFSYPKYAAGGLILTIISTPITLAVKWALEKFGPQEE